MSNEILLFQLFLIDFGFTIKRQRCGIFKLHDIWMKQQPAVYRGKLALVPENVGIDSREKLYGICKEKFVSVKVHGIDGEIVEVALRTPSVSYENQ
jgi:hypothetical protein